MSEVAVVRLDAPEAECWICGADHIMRHFVMGYEDMVLPSANCPQYPEWAGFPVCQTCSEFADQITVPTPAYWIAAGRIPAHMVTVEYADDG